MKPRVTVTIDELRLYGFDPRARRAIGEAVARELTQHFQREPPTAQPREVAGVVAQRVQTAVRKPC